MTTAHVMVPVPAEHVEAVTLMLRYSGVQTSMDVDPEALRKVVRSADVAAATVLDLVQASMAEEQPLVVGTVLANLQCSEREGLGVLMELNADLFATGGAMMMIPPGPGVAIEHWKILMAPAAAAVVADALAGR